MTSDTIIDNSICSQQVQEIRFNLITYNLIPYPIVLKQNSAELVYQVHDHQCDEFLRMLGKEMRLCKETAWKEGIFSALAGLHQTALA